MSFLNEKGLIELWKKIIDGTSDAAIDLHNISSTSHTDIRKELLDRTEALSNTEIEKILK